PKIDTSLVSTRMDGLIESAREVLAINNRIVDREVHRLRLKAEQVQRGLIVLVFFSTAVALTIALALTCYVARQRERDGQRHGGAEEDQHDEPALHLLGLEAQAVDLAVDDAVVDRQHLACALDQPVHAGRDEAGVDLRARML